MRPSEWTDKIAELHARLDDLVPVLEALEKRARDKREQFGVLKHKIMVLESLGEEWEDS